MGNNPLKRAKKKILGAQEANLPPQAGELPPDQNLDDLPDMFCLDFPNSRKFDFSCYTVNKGQKLLMPLTKAFLKSELRGALATISIELSYVNPSENHPLEVRYSFPLEEANTLVDFKARIEDREINTRVTEKEQARERYDDAMAAGKAAVIAETTPSNKQIEVRLGNLMPKQTAMISATIVTTLDILAGHYLLRLPADFHPDYASLGTSAIYPAYEFGYETRIVSDLPIASLSIPEGASVAEQNESRTNILVRGSQVAKSVQLSYRTADMMVPLLQYARCPDTAQVAMAVSMVPTFDPVEPQDFFEVVEDEEPEQSMGSKGSDFHFIFVLDRSGSMSGERIKLAKNALDLFIRSLPSGCTFSVINFGTSHNCMMYQGEPAIAYNDDSRIQALNQISSYLADLGGTNIMGPLSEVQANKKFQLGLKRRVFLLTDGAVSSPQQVISYAGVYSEHTRIYSFGLGSGCDQNLVRKVAEAGRGTATIIGDHEQNINGHVIKALAKAMEATLYKVQYGFPNKQRNHDELARNTLVFETELVTESEFSKIQFSFTSAEQQTQSGLNLVFTSADFREVEAGSTSASHLIKMAALNRIKELNDSQQKKEVSLMHQVLCHETAIIGVQKQLNKATGNMEYHTLDFEKMRQLHEGRLRKQEDERMKKLHAQLEKQAKLDAKRESQEHKRSIFDQKSRGEDLCESKARRKGKAQKNFSKAPVFKVTLREDYESYEDGADCYENNNYQESYQGFQDNQMQYYQEQFQQFKQQDMCMDRQDSFEGCYQPDQQQDLSAKQCMPDMGERHQSFNQMVKQSARLSFCEDLDEMDDQLADLCAEEDLEALDDIMLGACAAPAQVSMAPPAQVSMAASKEEQLQMAELEKLLMDAPAELQSAATAEPQVAAQAAPEQKVAQPMQHSMSLPDFRMVINAQISEGCWPVSCREMLKACVAAGQDDDPLVLQELSSVSEDVRESAYLTLLACFALAKVYKNYEGEWTLIVSKAKTWLESVGVPKPARVIKKFKLQLRQ